STATIKTPEPSYSHLVTRTIEACRVAKEAAGTAAAGIATGSSPLLNTLRDRERELDNLDMEIDAGVTSGIPQVTETQARVLRADAEMDRLRNLIFLRHIENPENVQRQASLQVIFMTQSLERAGDHVKNLAEEVCHFVSGHTVRHVLMTYDKPIEQMFLDWLRTREEPH